MMETHSTQPPVDNPDYGTGQFMRAVQIQRCGQGHYRLGVEDCVHAFLLEFRHDGTQLTQASGQWLRAPFTSCLGAPSALQALVHTPLTKDMRTLKGINDANMQCTHLFDALRLGIIHAAHDRADRRYDVVVPDMRNGITRVSLSINGQEAMYLDIQKPEMIIKGPAPYAERPILRGFGAWAASVLDADSYEKFFILQRALFVSHAREIHMPAYYNKPAPISGPPMGTCFGAQEVRFAQAVRQANTIMHSITPDMLLHFMHEA